MKKFLYPLIGALIITGCATSTKQPTPKISSKSIDLLDKYGINESSLRKVKDGYVFVIPDSKGTALYKLDENYNLVWKKVTPILLEPVKSQIVKNDIYILGYDQNKNLPAVLIYSTNGKLLSIKYYGGKYNLPKDFTFINGKMFVAVTKYSPGNNSDIVIYGGNKKITLNTPYMDDVSFIKPFKNGILIIGTIEKGSENVLIAYKTLNNKTVWAKTIDLGMDEKPVDVKIQNQEITIKISSSDNMGAEKDVTVKIDENGNLKKIKKGLEIEPLPLKYRT